MNRRAIGTQTAALEASYEFYFGKRKAMPKPTLTDALAKHGLKTWFPTPWSVVNAAAHHKNKDAIKIIDAAVALPRVERTEFQQAVVEAAIKLELI